MSTPVGEIDEVVKDVKLLVNKDEEILTDEKVGELLVQYNLEKMVSAKAPDTQEPVLVSAAGRVSDTSFVDPSTGNVHEFNHITRAFTGVSSH